MYVFGGKTNKRQITKLEGCKQKNTGTLDWNFYGGACANYRNTEIYLCFTSETEYDDSASSKIEQNRCRVAKSPTGEFKKTKDSKHDHRRIRIGVSNGKRTYSLLIITDLRQPICRGQQHTWEQKN